MYKSIYKRQKLSTINSSVHTFAYFAFHLFAYFTSRLSILPILLPIYWTILRIIPPICVLCLFYTYILPTVAYFSFHQLLFTRRWPMSRNATTSFHFSICILFMFAQTGTSDISWRTCTHTSEILRMYIVHICLTYCGVHVQKARLTYCVSTHVFSFSGSNVPQHELPIRLRDN